MLDTEGQKRVFNNFIELFVLPEITRRKKNGNLSDKFVLYSAQVIFYGDNRGDIVRLNKEVKLLAQVKLKDGIKKDKGDFVSLHDEIEELKNFRLVEEEEPECAHISMLKIKDHWLLTFDCRYNKGLAREHFKVAKQFYECAQYALQNKMISPFIDNLFSCVELLAKSELLLVPDEKFLKKTSHKNIQMKYNSFVDIGNAQLNFKTALNKLSGLRSSARYLKSIFQLSEIEAQKYLSIAREMFDYLESRLEKRLNFPT